MKWHDLVFSNSKKIRYRRHAIFWTAWLVYFGATYFYKQQAFIRGDFPLWVFLVLLKSGFLLIGHAFICYSTIYFALPRFLLKGRYFSFAGTLMCSGLVVTAWTYFCYAGVFTFFDTALDSSTRIQKDAFLWNSLMAGLLSSLKLVGVATTIKLLKRWWQKQEENMLLEKERIKLELQLLKAQIHPDFLFSSLDKIYYYAQTDTSTASSLLLKLSELLSYMLYECNKPHVPLWKEIKMIRDYMELEQTRFGSQLDVGIQINGSPSDEMIVPLLLLPFIENGFLFCENKNLEKCWLNLKIRITDQYFSMKLINGKVSSEEITTSIIEAGLANVQKRIEILYKDQYQLKITCEPDLMISFLKIPLVALHEANTFAAILGPPPNEQNQIAYATV